MQEILNRVATWNSKRYDREYSHPLTIDLLREEHGEWLRASKSVDKLDALCDVIYVSFGAMWKLNLKDEEMIFAANESQELAIKLVEMNELWPAYMIGTFLDVMEYDSDYPVLSSLWNIVTIALVEMTGLGLTPEQCEEALRIVCDANDTKTIAKTSPDVKANIDKGAFFVPPEVKLSKLLEACHGFN